VQLDRERGNVHQNLGEDALAIAELERARAGAEAVTNRRLALTASENLVYSLAELGRVPDAARQLTVANALDPGDHDRAIRLSLEARIAERGGDLPRAAALIEQAVAATGADATDELIILACSEEPRRPRQLVDAHVRHHIGLHVSTVTADISCRGVQRRLAPSTTDARDASVEP
jgi:tetratricopeptide (TPR) repeat protein